MSLITVWAVFTVHVCNISQYLTSIRELSWLWRACMSIWANESAVGRSLPLFLNEKKYSITFQNTVKHWSLEYNLKKRVFIEQGCHIKLQKARATNTVLGLHSSNEHFRQLKWFFLMKQSKSMWKIPWCLSSFSIDCLQSVLNTLKKD